VRGSNKKGNSYTIELFFHMIISRYTQRWGFYPAPWRKFKEIRIAAIDWEDSGLEPVLTSPPAFLKLLMEDQRR
jgi:hypothetical protein